LTTFDSVEAREMAWYDRVFLAMAVAPAGDFQLDLESPWRFRLHSLKDRLRAALEIVAYFRTLADSRRRECCLRLEKKIVIPHEALSGRVLTWEQIRTMRHAGISFGSHTLSHPVVSQLTPAEMERELGESKRLLEEKLECPVKDFAFPFGKISDYSATALERLSHCGYRSAVTTVPGVNTPQVNLYELRRLQVGDDSSLARFAFDLNQAFLRAEESSALSASTAEEIHEQSDRSSERFGDVVRSSDA
jgi:hypothetical protein